MDGAQINGAQHNGALRLDGLHGRLAAGYGERLLTQGAGHLVQGDAAARHQLHLQGNVCRGQDGEGGVHRGHRAFHVQIVNDVATGADEAVGEVPPHVLGEVFTRDHHFGIGHLVDQLRLTTDGDLIGGEDKVLLVSRQIPLCGGALKLASQLDLPLAVLRHREGDISRPLVDDLHLTGADVAGQLHGIGQGIVPGSLDGGHIHHQFHRLIGELGQHRRFGLHRNIGGGCIPGDHQAVALQLLFAGKCNGNISNGFARLISIHGGHIKPHDHSNGDG